MVTSQTVLTLMSVTPGINVTPMPPALTSQDRSLALVRPDGKVVALTVRYMHVFILI